MPMAELPAPASVHVYGLGRSRRIRELYSSGVTIEQISERVGAELESISRALRYKVGTRKKLSAEPPKHSVNEKPVVEDRCTVTGPSVAFDGPLRWCL